ncbi:Gfo/Idh/MocA family oxidoreductase [Rhizobium sp. KVB221]|uniref:Gfo/Idh/MocA family oxidoreductase n=1 Tax=Rhizobium setariae TaxID=2801340 RepID=A0A937CN17_9HYPH|nr:Gfo/Idh/MocA family oxidoreductase [Rhizobium setariae]MBL0373311.1 Gfo/Idh/MocA family oxidoreductase [Rhizobium setariae]
MTLFQNLRQIWPMPSAPKSIVIIGAGGIVKGAHLPAYRKWGLPVAGLYDLDVARAKTVAAEFEVAKVYESLQEALSAPGDVIFDVALPPQALGPILTKLPEGSTALIQKPLGVDAANAAELAAILKQRRITAATNFQLRFTPAMLAAEDAIARGIFGEIVELEVRLACRTPWETWPFLTELDAVEIPLHSIHYLDWIRATLGMPKKVYAKSVGHPDHPNLADARSSIVMDYGDRTRCCLSLNHTHKWGPDREDATIRIEGTKGAAIIGLGYLINYPDGAPERLEMITEGTGWQTVPLQGERMPDSFAAVMANLQRFEAGEDDRLLTAIPDSLDTMCLVDACLKSNRTGEVCAPQHAKQGSAL